MLEVLIVLDIFLSKDSRESMITVIRAVAAEVTINCIIQYIVSKGPFYTLRMLHMSLVNDFITYRTTHILSIKFHL